MNIAVIVPYAGKQKYQPVYDSIIDAVEHNGGHVLSPEKDEKYKAILSRDARLRDPARAHYEFIRKGIIDSDAVIVEVTHEDFKMGHETTLALLYRKPVLALSQSFDFGTYIHHPGFYGVQYKPDELPEVIKTFLKTVAEQRKTAGKLRHNQQPPRKRAKTIVVFGGVYADIFNQVGEIPKANEVILSAAFKVSLGGKATNAAVALARMGNEVFICGRLGHDSLGSDLESSLIYEGIKTDFLHQDAAAETGTVTLAVDKHAQFSTIVHEAANVLITKESVDALFHDVDAGKLQVDCIYLTLEQQPDIIDYVIREASKRKLFIFCDAAPHTRPLDDTLLPLVDILAPNQLEAKAMTDIDVRTGADAVDAIDSLSQKGAKQIILTMGKLGAQYRDAEGKLYAIKAVPVQAIDEAGAGDAFRAAFVHNILRNHNAPESLEAANAAGAYAVTHFGSYDSMPSLKQLAAFANAHRTQHASN